MMGCDLNGLQIICSTRMIHGYISECETVSQTNLRFDLARPVWIHILGERNLKKRQKERKELE